MFDVVIIGAGPAGTSTAHYLARSGLKVLVLDKADFPRDKICGDALTPRAVAMLDHIGVLPKIVEKSFRLNGIKIVAPGKILRSTSVEFNGTSGQPNYSLTIKRLFLDELLLQNALAAGIEFKSRVLVNNIISDSKCITVEGECNGKNVSFKGQVGILATGANLRVVKNLGLLKKKVKFALAIRGYCENMVDLNDQLLMFLHSLPQAGYGWVFPLSATTANVGVGLFSFSGGFPHTSYTLQSIFANYVKKSWIKNLIKDAEVNFHPKSYPLRTDFGSGPFSGERLLLVGEAAGLVNPLTGDGIDFALESGKLAAGFLRSVFESSDFSSLNLQNYDHLLLQSYKELFAFCNRLRYLHLHPKLLELTVHSANLWPDLKSRLVKKLLTEA